MSASRRLRAGPIPVLVLAIVLLAACGSSGKGGGTTSASTRPSTDAQIQIVAPTPSEVTGTDTVLKLNLVGATVLPASAVSGPIHGNEGHIHVTVDDQAVQMAFGLELPLNGLTPGTHTVKAQFVAVDHLPFKNSPTAAVVFQVGS